MKLTFTARAGRDLVRLRDFIYHNDPQAAQRASRQLRANIQTLIEQPNMGVPAEELNEFRELIARDYIVRYQVLADEIVILNVWHGKEDRS